MKKEPEELQQVSKFGEDLTAGEALEKMRSEGVTIGLVVDRVRSLPKALLSERELERADPKTKLEKLVMHAPELVSVKAPYKLSDVVQRHAKYVELRPNLPGVLVDVGEGFRVLPREIITKSATRVVTRGMNDGRLEGAPLDVLFYKCPIDNERKLVAYYDPKNPPRCTLGHG